MRDVFLMMVVLGIFAVGFFVMARLDRVLAENRKAMEKEDKAEEATCIMLTEDMAQEDVAREIREFREKHENMRVILYDGAKTEFAEKKDCMVKRKA